MAYKISDDCIACGTCAGVCPVGAISEGDGKYVIDADACLDCGTCAGECPVSAISEGCPCTQRKNTGGCAFAHPLRFSRKAQFMRAAGLRPAWRSLPCGHLEGTAGPGG